MNKVRELKIDSTLWATPATLVNLLDFKPEKLMFVNGCYDMSLKAVSMQNLTIINHNGNHYRVNFAFINQKDAYNLIKNATIKDKKGTL